MPRFLRTLLPCLLAIWLSWSPATAEDWPQFRGPHRSDISAETGLLNSWPEGGPRLLWMSSNCGVGFSGPSVVGGRLFIMGARNGVEQLLAIETDTGKELWALDVGDMLENDRGDGPRSTPTVAEDRVYALGARGNLVCASTTDGRKIWQVSLTDLGGAAPNWGYSESVLVDGSRVICTPGGAEGTVAALDAETGKVAWRSSEFTDAAQYASPLAFDWNGIRQYLHLTMRSIAGLSASDGKLLWRADFPGRTAVVPTPLYREGFVYVTAGYGIGCKLIRLGPDHSVNEVYFNKNMKNHHGGVILVGDHVYGYSDGFGWVCQDFESGELVWSEKERLGKGSLTFADGHFYCLDERDGTVALVLASPEGWTERGRLQLSPDSELRQPRWLFWTHPVVAGGRLYLRNQDLLFCYDIVAR